MANGAGYYGVGKKTEKLEGDIWTEIEEPPINEDNIYNYAVIFHGGYHYYFGGFYGHYSQGDPLDSIIALQEKTWTWSDIGKINTPRMGHAVILIGERLMVVGGWSDKKNEACVLKNGKFNCTELTSSLFRYQYTPILFLVDNDFDNC